MSEKLFEKDQLMKDIEQTYDDYDEVTLQEMWEYKRWIFKTILEVSLQSNSSIPNHLPSASR